MDQIRTFVDSGWIDLGPITLLVGTNNVGKSTVLHSLYAMQTGAVQPANLIRSGSTSATIGLKLADIDASRYWGSGDVADAGELTITLSPTSISQRLRLDAGATAEESAVQPIAPYIRNAFVSPFLAKRKVPMFQEAINKEAASNVSRDFTNLPARFDALNDSNHPDHQRFHALLGAVVNVPLSAVASDNGKRIGIWVDGTDAIYVDNMGEGITQMIGLITALCLSDGRLFLIEELENDLHPEALKALLAAIEDSSERNQFVISTHNNVVVRSLGAIDSTLIYELSLDNSNDERRPTTVVSGVRNDPHERMSLLRRLGYELSDLDLWDGWIFLEESSAERMIRQYLIPWFVPELKRFRTVASEGIDDVSRSFSAIRKLVLYAHLEPMYKDRTVVIVDGGDVGVGHNFIRQLRNRFSEMPPDTFRALSQQDFEHYYPKRFAEAASVALAQASKSAKRQAKRELLDEVLAWVAANESEARTALETSAAEVIDELRHFAARAGRPTT